ncbi:phosphohexomutase domain-containing protein [Halopenitus persicus]|uniref:Phosphoglucosamine mutase n=1 Tax=Halopenitus persicus TaxID=1048396 RepID=A0A1H3DPY7_9EURY|nr:phosphoglucosamine mutase [Halopenitus persicus]SDX68573.1 phosphoglucosamine mutase [Halopenitus persicus]
MFGTSGVRGPVGEEVTAALAVSIGRALGIETDAVVVGRDVRDSGRALVDALAAGLVESGTDVLDVGVAATPTIARAVGGADADAGVAVTASHNPPSDNGFKLWTPSGQAFDAAAQNRIADRVRSDAFDPADPNDHGRRHGFGDVFERPATDSHRAAIVDAGRRALAGVGERGAAAPLSGTRVVVDLGNGTGRVTADALVELGATVETLNGQRDGRFPGRPSEPTAETCASLRSHVAGTDADLGIAHDGDADRMMAVADDGRFLEGDALLALLARAAVADAETGADADAETGADEDAGAAVGDTGGVATARVAAPLNTSLAVDDALEAVGAELVRTRVGDVAVAERAAETGVVFGGEPSGAWIFPTETLCPDGPLAAVRITALAAERSLSERVGDLPSYPIRRGNREVDAKESVMDALVSIVDGEYDAAAVSTLDGVRVETDDGWLLVRASGTQPLIRLTAQARTDSETDALYDRAATLLDRAIDAAE